MDTKRWYSQARGRHARGSGLTLDRQGFALVGALLVLVALGILATVGLRTTGADRTSATALRQSVEAFYAAEGGLSDAISRLSTSSVDALDPGDSLDMGWVDLDRGRYRAVVRRVDGSAETPTYALGLTGQGPSGSRRRVEALVSEQKGSVFQFAGFGKISLTMSGGDGWADSYDSSLGPYDPVTAGSGGNLVSNGDITLNNSTVVAGDVKAGGVIKNGGGILGDTASGAPPVPDYPIDECPAGGYTPAGLIPSGAGITYNESTGDLRVNGGNSLVLTTPPTEYFFSSITLGGGSTLTVVPTGGSATIWISHDFTAGGGGVVNTGAKPADVGIRACGSGEDKYKDWDMSGGTGSYLTVYAPNRTVVISGGGDLWGSVISEELTVTGGSRLHFDEALSRGGGTGGYAVIPGTWREIF